MVENAYLFSRKDWTELSAMDAVSLSGYVFFQMWQKRFAPYLSLKEGDVVYIGDTTTRMILWEARVSVLLTNFQYRSRKHALGGLRAAYGLHSEDLNDYHKGKKGHGWLLAWSPIVMARLGVALPEGQMFGRNGYRALSADALASIGLPEPRPIDATPLASPPPWYEPAAATSGTPRNVPRYIPLDVRREVWERDQGRCVGCGTCKNLHFDHIQPYSLGGPATVENLRLLCARSNLSKGAGSAGDQPACAYERRDQLNWECRDEDMAHAAGLCRPRPLSGAAR